MIKELLNEKDSILVFDIDGVLALLEFGKYNHYDINDEEWSKAVLEGNNFYTEDKVSNKMQEFLKDKDKNKVYVITTVFNDNELEFKKQFVNKYYDILCDHVYSVNNDSDKKNILNKIRNKYKDIDDKKIVMIDDSVSVLNDIMDNTNFSTVHISSFLDV